MLKTECGANPGILQWARRVRRVLNGGARVYGASTCNSTGDHKKRDMAGVRKVKRRKRRAPPPDGESQS
jgi:hypothetical protein